MGLSLVRANRWALSLVCWQACLLGTLGLAEGCEGGISLAVLTTKLSGDMVAEIACLHLSSVCPVVGEVASHSAAAFLMWSAADDSSPGL